MAPWNMQSIPAKGAQSRRLNEGKRRLKCGITGDRKETIESFGNANAGM